MKSKLLYLSLLIGLSFSCSDFLEPKSENEFVPTKVSSLEELLTFETYRANFGLYGLIPMFEDDIAQNPKFNSDEDYLDMSSGAIFAAYTWQSNMYDEFDKEYVGDYDIWTVAYKAILGTNAVLDYIDGVEGTEREKNSVTAQACALRAYYYFYLVNCFGLPYNYDKNAPGVPLKLTAGVKNSSMPRNTVGEVYEQVLKDLLRAEKLYLTMSIEDQWKPDYKVSLPFVQLLLSRVYLYMEEWQKASDYAGKVIENPAFRLVTLDEFPANAEEYEIQEYYVMHNYNCPEAIWVYSRLGDVCKFINTTQFTEYYELVGVMRTSWDLFDSYSMMDKRGAQYLVQEYSGAWKKPYGKFAIDDSYNPTSGYGNSDYNARSFRLSEAYLNQAEAEAMLYKLEGAGEHKTKAMDLLNTLRRNRLPVGAEIGEPSTPDRLVEATRNERRRELCFEGHRWFDLRRYGMPEIKHVWYTDATNSVTYTLREKDPAYVLPIPTDVLLLNKELVQNPLAPERND